MDNVGGLIPGRLYVLLVSKLNRQKICLLNSVYRLLLHCLFIFFF